MKPGTMVSLLLSACCIQAQADQSSPHATVRTFFAMIEQGDEQGIRHLVRIDRYEAYRARRSWFLWVGMWESCVATKIGDYVKTEDGGRFHASKIEEVGEVEAVLDCKYVPAPEKKFIKVTKMNGQWYWDEN